MEDRDIKEFRRLRNYYRINFKSGHSDESFVLWCETMVRELAQLKESAEAYKKVMG